MERAIAAARRAFDETDWSTNHALRLTCLTQLRDALLEAEDEFREQIMAETGATLFTCGDMGPQCENPIRFMDYTLESLPRFQWSRDIGIHEIMGGKSRRLVEKEAIGVVACITPWNVPLQINLAKCVPALAAGFIQIELDLETGKFQVLDYVGVADCGTVIHPAGLAQQIKGCNSVYQVRFPVRIRGKIEVFTGWRAVHSEHRLPTKGGLRYAPEVDQAGPHRQPMETGE